MNPIDLNFRMPGLRFDPQGRALLHVWAPRQQSLSLYLPATATHWPMTPAGEGWWHIHTAALRPGDRYQIALADGSLRPDPASLLQPGGVHAASEAFDTNAFCWTDDNWRNHRLDDYIFYELHTGTFTEAGNFDGVISRLDYLKELGITAIELMPVAAFPGNRNWGYDGVCPFAVHEGYGGPLGLQRLVNACHARGIAVVLDVVYNHLGPEGNYMGDFAPFTTKKYNTPWGEAINFDDAGCDGLRRYVIENALMWLRDFHIDALRLDAVHAIFDLSPRHILQELRQHVDGLMAATGRVHYLIVECDLNDPKFINPPASGGYGMDAQWTDEFHHALRVACGQERHGYYADFDGVDHLAKAYADAYVYDGQYSEHRQKHFGLPVPHQAGRQFVVFAQNHDQVGNRMLGERSAALYSFELQKLLPAAVMVSPFLPLIFMGEEWAETNPFLYFVSHTDAELAEAVRAGRKAEFAAFHQQGEAPDPMAPETFERSRLQWQLPEQEPHRHMLAWYRELIFLRKTHPALRHTNRQHLQLGHKPGAESLSLLRRHEEQQLICLLNFGAAPAPFILPDAAMPWSLLLNSADPVWLGAHKAPETLPAGAEVMAPPQSILIYTCNYV